MATLSRAARAALSLAGIAAKDWAGGDSCGCTDDRCVGFHHGAEEPCYCLPVLIDDYLRERR